MCVGKALQQTTHMRHGSTSAYTCTTISELS